MDKAKKKERIEWVDICRALAIIFVFLGHWNTLHLHEFAYSFHLKLFFILSGFFAIDCVKKNTFKEYVIKKIKSLYVPMLLWGMISFFWNHLDTTVHLQDFIHAFSDIRNIQPNYWFFPALFTISIAYYLLKKYIHHDTVILIISYLLMVCFGKYGFLPISLPSHIIFRYLFLESIFTYLFWYSLGVVSFSYIRSFIQEKDSSIQNKRTFHFIGIAASSCSFFLFFKNIIQIFSLPVFLEYHPFIHTNYLIVTSLINIITMIYLSTFLTKSSILKEIGSNTMSHMGLEFITHGFLSITIFDILHAELPNMASTYSVLLFTFIQFLVHIPIIRIINIYCPILGGKIKK